MNEQQNENSAASGRSDSKALLDAVKSIRAADCGGWLKDCQTGLFRCSDGREKRLELARLLDQLYTAAGI